MELKKITYLLVIICLLFASCEFLLGKDDELFIKRENYNGYALKLDGYYYRYLSDYAIYTFFLNRNGTLSTAGSFEIDKGYKYEKWFLDSDFKEKVAKMKISWGVFKISGEEIILEKWYSKEGPKPAFISKGQILNDTTFILTKLIKKKGGAEKSINEVYHFKKFKHKLDSVSKFID